MHGGYTKAAKNKLNINPCGCRVSRILDDGVKERIRKMVLGFDKRFIDPIRTGMKIHTLREDKLLRWKAGMTIQMATGIRTKKYKCFNETLCHGIQKMQMLLDVMPEIWIDGRKLKHKEIELLAKNDGFYELADFVHWFSRSKYLREAGDNMIELRIIHWSDFRY